MGSGPAALMASKYNDPKHGIKALGELVYTEKHETTKMTTTLSNNE